MREPLKATKAIVAAVGTLATVLATVLADNLVTSTEWGTVAQVAVGAAFTLATALGVYQTENKPKT